MISLADPDARPIRKGKPSTTQFGYAPSSPKTTEVSSHSTRATRAPG